MDGQCLFEWSLNATLPWPWRSLTLHTTNFCSTGFSSSLDESPRLPVLTVEGGVALKLLEGVLNGHRAMQCCLTMSWWLGVKKVANKIVKHIVKLILPTAYLVIAYRVNLLNMGPGGGQQRPPPQHGQLKVGGWRRGNYLCYIVIF